MSITSINGAAIRPVLPTKEAAEQPVQAGEQAPLENIRPETEKNDAVKKWLSDRAVMASKGLEAVGKLPAPHLKSDEAAGRPERAENLSPSEKIRPAAEKDGAAAKRLSDRVKISPEGRELARALYEEEPSKRARTAEDALEGGVKAAGAGDGREGDEVPEAAGRGGEDDEDGGGGSGPDQAGLKQKLQELQKKAEELKEEIDELKREGAQENADAITRKEAEKAQLAAQINALSQQVKE